MRRANPLYLALAGLALLAPSSALAGLPGLDSESGGLPRASRAKKKHVPRLCPVCAAKYAAQGMPVTATSPVMVQGSANCTACAEAATASATAPGAMPAPVAAPAGTPSLTLTAANDPTPGFATVGDPAPAAMASPGGAPGIAYVGSVPGTAVVGGTVVSAEPAPIGVVRTSYKGVASPGGGPAPGGAGMAAPNPGAMGPGGVPYARMDELPPSLYGGSPGRQKPHILGHILGLRGPWIHAAEMEARARENHAAISYGPGGASSATDLPASAVYGR